MPIYKVCLQQYVEEIASLNIEAADPEEARDKALEQEHRDFGSIEWRPGDDAYATDCYAVMDENNVIVWER